MENGNLKLDYKNTLILGTGFMAISMVWSLFNSYVPIFLAKYIASTTIIGYIMTLDNWAGMTIQPLITSISDRTWRNGGRRMPYLKAGIPIAAVFVILLPLNFNLLTIIVSILMLDLSMSIFRGPTVALMPDLTAPKLRSKANGIINFMGGLGALMTYFLGSRLYDIHPALPFALAALIMVGVLYLLVKKIKEPQPGEVGTGQVTMAPEGQEMGTEPAMETEASKETAKKGNLLKTLFRVIGDHDKSCFFLLLAILFWFIGWSGIDAFFTTYGQDPSVLGSESVASRLLGYFSLTFLIFAIPSGFIATKIGRKRTISIGILCLTVVLCLLFFFKTKLTMSVLLACGGIGWSLININSYPMVVEMGKGEEIGSYTGLYYLFSSIAAVIAPPLFGQFMDWFGKGVIFILAAVSLVIAFLFITRVRAGEAVFEQANEANLAG